MSLADDQNKTLEVTVYDHDIAGKDDFMGRYVMRYTVSEISLILNF